MAAIALSVAVGILGSVILARATARGIGVSADSAVYLSAAGSLRKDGLYDATGEDGLPEPLVHKPPGYPGSLAVLSALFRTTPLEAARAESIVLFGATATLLGVWAAAHVRGPIWLAPFSALVFVATPVAAQAYSMAWSEPGLLFFGYVGLFLLVCDGGRGKTSLLVAAGLALAAAFAFRHTGITFVFAGVLLVLLAGGRPWAARLRDAFAVGLLSAAPSALFYVRNRLIAGRATFAALRVFPVGTSAGKGLANRFLEWFCPDERVAGPAAAGAILVVLAAMRYGASSAAPGNGVASRRASSLFAVVLLTAAYLALLLLSKLFFFSDIPIDYRYMIPVLPAAILLLAHALRWAWESSAQSPAARAATAVFAGILLLGRYAPYKKWFRETVDNPADYAQPRWKNAGVVAEAAALSAREPGQAIFSNGAGLIEFQTGKRFACLPVSFDYYTGLPNPSYRQELRVLARRVQRGRAFVVELKAMEWQPYYPKAAELRRFMGNALCHEISDGMVCGDDRANLGR